jgi:hypothetical protein
LVDFFKDECSNVLSDRIFGLCDDNDKREEPAYTDTNKNGKNEKDDWIATVINDGTHNIRFIAVDNCIGLYKQDGSLDKRCDAMMAYDDNIIFVELKNRGYSGWISDSLKQLKSTITHFNKNYNTHFKKTAYIANKMRPNTKSFHGTKKNEFKDETGVNLTIKATIEI